MASTANADGIAYDAMVLTGMAHGDVISGQLRAFMTDVLCLAFRM
jgi:hypothetical protein